MRKFCVLTMFLVFGLIFTSSVKASVYTINSEEFDLVQMSHYWYYTWGINWTLPETDHIVAASITYNNIYNNAVEPDQLYTHLLNTVVDPNGNLTDPDWQNANGYQSILISGVDNQEGGDQFAGQGLLLGVWDDPVGGIARGFNLSYNIPSANFSWLSDGNFGFGIDPDCHYYTEYPSGVTVRIETVPEPASMLLLGCGLLGLGFFGRKRLIK